MKHNILLVDDEAIVRKSMTQFLQEEGFFVKAVSTADEALAHIRQKTIPFSLALIDHHLEGIKGSALIRDIRIIDSKLNLLGFSGDDSVEAHNESLDSGALMFVSKDTNNRKLLGIVHRICKEFERRTKPLQTTSDFSANQKLIESVGLVGASEQMAEVVKLVLKVSTSDHTVLIRGENGTGKEKVAKAIHDNSSRARGPFIGINCAAIPESLIESELFGHEKGAFTGAVSAKIGKFQIANNGTIFLDEIGEVPIHMQVKLLRVLQEKEITPVGSNTTKKINARILAATNANLEKKIADGTFREDLFYRLNVIPVNIAPLRERPADIPSLIFHFLKMANQETGVDKKILDICVRELQKRPWPGNVRDLGHTIKRLHLWAEGSIIDEDTLDCLLEEPVVDVKTDFIDYDTLMHRQLNDEKQLIIKVLSQSINMTDAANRLGISRTTLRDRIKTLKLKSNNQPKGEI